MASIAPTRLQKRKVCPKCGQSLSHAAYARHLNPNVCPEKNFAHNSSQTTLEPTCALQPTARPDCTIQPMTSLECAIQPTASSVVEQGDISEELLADTELSDNSSSDSSVESDCIEVLSDDDECFLEFEAGSPVGEEEEQSDSVEMLNCDNENDSTQMMSTERRQNRAATEQLFHNIVMHICLYMTFFNCVLESQNVVSLFFTISLDQWCLG